MAGNREIDLEKNFRLIPLGDDLEARVERAETLLAALLEVAMYDRGGKLLNHQFIQDHVNAYRPPENRLDYHDDFNPEY